MILEKRGLLNSKQETWGMDTIRQGSAQCNLSATTATYSWMVFWDTEWVQEDLS